MILHLIAHRDGSLCDKTASFTETYLYMVLSIDQCGGYIFVFESSDRRLSNKSTVDAKGTVE